MFFYPHCPQYVLFMDTEEKGRVLADRETLHAQKRVRYFCCWRKGYIPPPSITVPTWSEKNGKNYIRDIQNNLISISLIVIKSLAKVFLRKKKVGGLTLVHSDRGCCWLLQTPTRNCPSRTQFDTWCYPQSRKYQPKIIQNISVLFTELFVIDILTLNTCRSLTNYW